MFTHKRLMSLLIILIHASQSLYAGEALARKLTHHQINSESQNLSMDESAVHWMLTGINKSLSSVTSKVADMRNFWAEHQQTVTQIDHDEEDFVDLEDRVTSLLSKTQPTAVVKTSIISFLSVITSLAQGYYTVTRLVRNHPMLKR